MATSLLTNTAHGRGSVSWELDTCCCPFLLPWLIALESSGWGATLEGLALGCVITIVIAASGPGGDFIYFQY